MSAAVVAEPELAPSPARQGGDRPRRRHLTRMSERRWDGTVETLCGIVATEKPPRSGPTEKCKECLEVLGFIRELDGL